MAADSPRPDVINWVYGPREADLGDLAKIYIPAGYQFANADDARVLLKRMNNPVPPSLAGILTSPGSRGMVIFEFTDTGYIRDDDDVLDAAVILQKLQQKVDRQNQQVVKEGITNTISSVEWMVKPEYNRNEHLMEWAIRADSGTGKTINHIVRLLGREGVLDGIAVQPEQLGVEPIPLRRLMLGVTFKEGHTYADYRAGDVVCRQGLAGSITAEASGKRAGLTRNPAMTYGLAGAGVLVIGVGIWVVRRRKKRLHKEQTPAQKAAAAAPLASFAKETVAVPANGSSTSHEKPVNGKINGHHKLRRRKIFDYQKYYSDLLFQVSDRAYEMDYTPVARFRNASNHQEASDHAPGPAVVATNLGLIESQKNLIEEQQRLIREQTKLIEEKTRLIQEKNQVLEKQAELFGNNVF